MALDYSNGSIIQQGLLDAFNEGGQYYVAYTAAAPMLTVRERGGQLQVLPVAASIPGSPFDMVKTPGAAYTQASGSYTGVSFACAPVVMPDAAESAREIVRRMAAEQGIPLSRAWAQYWRETGAMK